MQQYRHGMFRPLQHLLTDRIYANGKVWVGWKATERLPARRCVDAVDSCARIRPSLRWLQNAAYSCVAVVHISTTLGGSAYERQQAAKQG